MVLVYHSIQYNMGVGFAQYMTYLAVEERQQQHCTLPWLQHSPQPLTAGAADIKWKPLNGNQIFLLTVLKFVKGHCLRSFKSWRVIQRTAGMLINTWSQACQSIISSEDHSNPV